VCGKNIEVDSMVNVAMTQPYYTVRLIGCYSAEEGRRAQILRARSSTDNNRVSLPLSLCFFSHYIHFLSLSLFS
jgi:hypothetical protein